MMSDKFRSTQIISKLFTIAITIFLSFAFAISTQAATFTVTKTADSNDGTCDSDCSLREAVAAANGVATDDIIEFASPLFDTAQTINHGGTEIEITNNGSLTINGTGAKLLNIDGNNQDRIFRITSANVTINDLTITNGRSSGGGGILVDRGQLTINRLAISNNFATASGGGLALVLSTANINDSIISGNTVLASSGCGVFLDGGSTLTMVNSTVSGNQANGVFGGGIFSGGTLTIINSTIASNSANTGGGIYQSAGTVSLLNTIVANNSATNQGNDIFGTVVSQGYNLIEDTTNATINGDTTGNITDQDPMLGALADNGGSTMTHRLMPGSPAIDAGDPNNFPPFDQRGNVRPADGNPTPLRQDISRSKVILALLPDIGAFEALAPTSAGVSVSGKVITNGKGRAISRTIVQMTDISGNIRTVRTNQFGYFRFEDVQAGETYIFNVYSRRYQFAPQVINVSENLDSLIFKPSETTNRIGKNRYNEPKS